MSKLILKGQRAKEASYELMNATTTQKNEALLKMAEKLLGNKDYIIKENKKDLDKAIEKGTTEAMLDRLKLDEKRLADMADGLREVVALADPVGGSYFNVEEAKWITNR